MTAVPLPEAARALGLSTRQLERDIVAGAPVARRGSRGRGHATLVDVVALEAWRRSRDDRLRMYAAELPELIAGAVWAAFVAETGPHKRALAGALASAWYQVSTAALDRARRDVPDLPELSALPEKITALRRILSDTRTVCPSPLPE